MSYKARLVAEMERRAGPKVEGGILEVGFMRCRGCGWMLTLRSQRAYCKCALCGSTYFVPSTLEMFPRLPAIRRFFLIRFLNCIVPRIRLFLFFHGLRRYWWTTSWWTPSEGIEKAKALALGKQYGMVPQEAE